MAAYQSNLNKLVFDVETAGEKFEDLDKTTQELLELRFKRTAKDDAELELAKQRLSFYPETCQIVCIGMMNPDTDKGVAYYQGKEPQASNQDGVQYVPCVTEKDLLEHFWDDAARYEEFISFNGNTFDVPMIMLRSAVQGIRPSKNLAVNRYLNLQPANLKHVDLFDQLSFYNARWGGLGLHFWSRAFGIASPKEGEISGDKVTEAFYAGRGKEIAMYCMDDVKATAKLYEQWTKFLRFS